MPKNEVVVLFNPYHRGNKGVHAFLKGIILKVNAIARLGFEPALKSIEAIKFPSKQVICFQLLF